MGYSDLPLGLSSEEVSRHLLSALRSNESALNILHMIDELIFRSNHSFFRLSCRDEEAVFAWLRTAMPDLDPDETIQIVVSLLGGIVGPEQAAFRLSFSPIYDQALRLYAAAGPDERCYPIEHGRIDG